MRTRTLPLPLVLGIACALLHNTALASEPEDDNLPFENVDVSELVEQTEAPPDNAPAPVSTQPVMSPVGVNDPFPDRAPRVRPRSVAMLLSLGVGASVVSVVLARLSLLPSCTNRSVAASCEIPDAGDIGFRGGRLVGSVAFSIGGAAFGALGGRALGQLLAQAPASKLEKRRRLAVGLGVTGVVFGVAGLATGATLFGVGTNRAVDLARGIDTAALGPADLARLDQTIDEVARARAGLMVLVASPAILATGIALLVHRPRPRNWKLAPNFSRTSFGISLSGRF